MKALLCLLLSLSIISCTTLPSKKAAKEAPVETAKDYKHILSKYKKKSSSKNLSSLIQFAERNPDLEISNHAYVIAGDHFRNKNKELSLKYYLRIINSPYYSKKEWIARLRAGQITWSLKDSYRTQEFDQTHFPL